MTTPSALSKVASHHFLDAQPPLLFQEGTTFSSASVCLLTLSLSRIQCRAWRSFLEFEIGDRRNACAGRVDTRG